VKLPIILSGLVLLFGCGREKGPVVSSEFVDSLFSHYTEPAFARINDSSMQFWKNRVNPALPGLVSESKYASALAMRFHLYGDITDIRRADSVIRKVDRDYNHREAAADLTLVGYSILQHRFREADSCLQKAEETGLKKYDQLTASYDVDFELGRYNRAVMELKQLNAPADYGYYFRLSKMDHLNGLLDSSIDAMLRAASLEEGSPYLKQVALSNAADLYMHEGKMQEAAGLYIQCIRLNSADFHSITGLGWIALVHDKNDSLAGKIFRFVQARNQLPDALYKLTQLADQSGDSYSGRKYAKAFETRATGAVYGNMYNKYLIELYTGILNEPARAELISERELGNRATPQTYAWYVWSLFCNHKKEEAYKEYLQYVSGKPLEALELYWMGKLMKGLNKGYNAQAFFKAAHQNKYDLSPGILKDLEQQLD
jgi:hypothetical protein